MGIKQLRVPTDIVQHCWKIARKRSTPTQWSQVALEILKEACKDEKDRNISKS
jgi:hypothetical protein